ncbi:MULTISPECIES: capping complex subunit for YIEGIA [unclassified Sedimentibacter]|uniref:capping complex subunit for YIEGIA n=1 Tax=unclassified Sedimentibacter TaxID=2649220 RepID=UPI0027E02113|nr:hypothetical protein [Sedimentibacter sp. MB35-C1]WMJ78799.1 hypothetical protein RBQ61_07695 [Sedimentibacter sp. MB35-C1]
MAKEKAEIIAYITLNKERVFGGNPLILIANNVEEQKILCRDIGKAMRANVSQLSCGDYIIIK